ncbi:MAG: substrate-binding domain-containing protein [Bauldia sp.]
MKPNREMGGTFGRKALLAAAVAIVGLAGMAGGASAAGKSFLIFTPMRDHPVLKIMAAGAVDKCKELGDTCEVVGNPSATEFDIPASIPLAEAAMSRTKFDGVAVIGNDPTVNPFIEELSKDGLPVVAWHVLPPEGSVPGLNAATGEVVPEAGANAAAAMGAEMGGKGVVAVTQGSFNTAENDMASSFKKTMADKFPDIKVLDPQLEGFEPSAAAATAVAILQGNGDITGAFSTTGNGVLTWSGAARTADRKLVIVGMDYTRQNLDIVKAGDAFGLVAQPLYEEGAKSVELLADIADGKKPPYSNPLPATVIKAGDLDPYYAKLKSAGQ